MASESSSSSTLNDINDDPLSLIEFAIVENKPNNSLLNAIIDENESKLEQIAVHLIVFGFNTKVTPKDFSWVIKTLLGSSDPDNPLLGKLLRSVFLNFNQVRYLIESSNFVDYQDCVTALSYGESDRIAERVLSELDDIFGPQHYEVYERLVSILQPPNYIAPTNMDIADFNRVVYSHVLNRAKGISHYATVPKWILKISKPTPDDIPYNDPKSIPIKLPNNEEAAEMLVDSIRGDIKGGCKEEDLLIMKSTIIGAYSAAENDLKKIYILLPVYHLFLERGKENITTFRFFGPSNPIINSDGLSSEVCTRMLCDTSYFDHDIDEIDYLGDEREIGPLEWVEDTCDKCNKKIRQYNHSVRMPKEGGGWLGCYCSWECVEQDLLTPSSEAETMIYEIRKYLIDYFRMLIDRIGIYDINED
jgi:hypothetical protein